LLSIDPNVVYDRQSRVLLEAVRTNIIRWIHGRPMLLNSAWISLLSLPSRSNT